VAPAYLGWRQVDGPRWKDLEEFLFARAMEHDSPKLLFRLACEYLSSSRLVRPGVVLVLERVATARKRARKQTWQRVEPALTGFLRDELDGMLVPDPLLGRTRLAWLGTGPVSSTPAAVKGELEKLAYLRGMDAHTLDLSVLPAERRRFLAGLGRLADHPRHPCTHDPRSSAAARQAARRVNGAAGSRPARAAQRPIARPATTWARPPRIAAARSAKPPASARQPSLLADRPRRQ
jgi:Domain of unknown function (DUF4158)